MKRNIRFFLSGFVVLAMITLENSCQKNNGSNSSKPQLTLSSSTIKRNQPLVASTNVISADLVVKWSVNSPASSAWLSSSGNRSVILFSNSGNYTVTASYFVDSTAAAPYDSSSSPVIVTDSIYNDSSGQSVSCTTLEQVPISNDDQIFLTPVNYSDTGLAFIAHTQLTYGNQYPWLNFETTPDTTSGYGFVFATVTENPCGNSTALPVAATGIPSINPLTIGTHDFTVILNGNVYQGELEVTATSCTFIWNYTSGVTISPLTITRQ
jgi:hypothetical protein